MSDGCGNPRVASLGGSRLGRGYPVAAVAEIQLTRSKACKTMNYLLKTAYSYVLCIEREASLQLIHTLQPLQPLNTTETKKLSVSTGLAKEYRDCTETSDNCRTVCVKEFCENMRHMVRTFISNRI
jgi:hypothetical protein